MNILLLGGEGFLGQGLQREFNNRNIKYKSLDINDIDLYKTKNKYKLINILEYYDNIVILSSKIGAKLFETDAVNAANYNKQIYDNVIYSLKNAAIKFKKSFNVTNYSTSEVFCSQTSINDFITEDSQFNFDYSNPRYLYSYIKWQTGNELFNIHNKNPDIISAVKIIRPFNIYGRNQKRGVVYDMIKSALYDNKIFYAENTTRSMTDIDFASRLSVDTILSNKNIKINVVDSRNSITMKTLANIINNILNINSKLIELPYDRSIQYRHVSKVDNNIKLTKKIMTPHILEIKQQIIENI